jgi:hypothetical protein
VTPRWGVGLGVVALAALACTTSAPIALVSPSPTRSPSPVPTVAAVAPTPDRLATVAAAHFLITPRAVGTSGVPDPTVVPVATGGHGRPPIDPQLDTVARALETAYLTSDWGALFDTALVTDRTSGITRAEFIAAASRQAAVAGAYTKFERVAVGDAEFFLLGGTWVTITYAVERRTTSGVARATRRNISFTLPGSWKAIAAAEF